MYFKTDSYSQAVTKLKSDCARHLKKCRESEGKKVEILSEADKKIEAISQEVAKLEDAKVEASQERKRLQNTRNAILCKRCQNPLAASAKLSSTGAPPSNLGLRSCGDGEMDNEALDALASLKRKALDEELFLTQENEYLQSVL